MKLMSGGVKEVETMPTENSPNKPKVRTLKNQVLDVHELELQNDQGKYDKIRRVLLKTNMGAIVYKPYRLVDDTGQVSGFKCTWRKKEPLDLSELPPMLWELNKRLETGVVKIRITYCVITDGDEEDGKETLFMRMKHVNEMEFLDLEERAGP